MEQGLCYKEVLQNEIEELSKNDIKFLCQLITIIRIHKQKQRNTECR